MTYTILVTAPKLASAGLNRLEQAACRVVFLNDTNNSKEVESILASQPVDAVISRTVDLTASAIESCPTLKVISKHGVGVSNIDIAAATARGIPVYVTPGANAQSVAEMTLGLMFAAARRINWMDSELRAGRWTRAQDGLQLGGRTLGLVGFGQVGQKVARAAHALGMHVAVFDPVIKSGTTIEGVEVMNTLSGLLERAEVLSLHVPLNSHTRNMIGEDELSLLPPEAIVINTARGEVIDEQALINALSCGRVFSAGLDTTAHEPIAGDNPLLAMKNVVLCPHVGGSTPAALAAMALGAAENVLGYLDGQHPDIHSCVNPNVFQSSTEATP
jgi:D-3-phosphoglycerate dehydrogenase